MTRAGIASMDRKSKEKMHDKTYQLDKKMRTKELAIKQQEADVKADRAKYQNISDVGKTVKDVGKGAASIGALINHPSWYKKFGVDQFVSPLPQFTRVGEIMREKWLGNDSSSAVAGLQASNVVPGVCVIQLLSTLPNQTVVAGTGYASSPINVGLSRFMAELRKMNSRIGDYDASDFGLYWYAAADVVFVLSKIAQGIRIYNTYYAANAYYARSLIYAIGFDAVDFFAHIQEYKVLLAKCQSIFNSSVVIPTNLTFILRRLWLANAIVRDHGGEKSQCYVFNFPYLGTLSEDEASVIYADYDTSRSFTSISGYLDVAIRRLIDSVGMQTMMADLRAGIPDNKMLKLTLVEEIDKPIEYYDDVLNKEQIHNLRTNWANWNPANGAEQYISTLNLNIHAMTDGYICQGQVDSGHTTMTDAGPVSRINAINSTLKADLGIAQDSEYLNYYTDDVTTDDVLEGTRLRHTVIAENASDSFCYSHSANRGTEQVLRFDICSLGYNGTTLFRVPFTTVIICTNGASLLNCYNAIAQVASRFDWLPTIKVCDNEDQLFYTHGEIDNYFPVAPVNLLKLHEACTLSEFYIDSAEFARQIR